MSAGRMTAEQTPDEFALWRLEAKICDCGEASGHLTRCRWLLVAPALAAAVREARAAELRIVRLVEQDMAEQATQAWHTADARRGLADHAALEVHADALTRWSERLRMAFEGQDYRADRIAVDAPEGGEGR